MTAARAADQADRLRQLAGVRKANQAEEARQDAAPRVISVTSGKQGVGNTFVTVNLARALAAAGSRVLVVDADPAMAGVFQLLGMLPPFTVNQVLSGERRLEEVVVDAGGGIKILPAGMGVPQYQALSPSGKLFLAQNMDNLKERFDYVLIDAGTGVSANVTGFAVEAAEVLLVVTPEPSSIMETYALVKTLFGRNESLSFRLVVNRCRDAEQGGALFGKLTAITGRFLELSMDYLGYILYDEMLVESVRRRGTLCRLYPEAKASKNFGELAEKLTTDRSAALPGAPLDPPAARVKEWRNHELSS